MAAAVRKRRGEGTAAPWLAKIDDSLAREDTWRKKGRKVVMRFRDERSKSDAAYTSRVNILWSNTEILKAALYARTAKPDVRRRFPDAKRGNSASRVAAEVLERAVSYCIDTEDVDAPLSSAIEDMLLPGRGTVWVSYEPEIEEPEEDDGPDTGNANADATSVAGGNGSASQEGAGGSTYAGSGERSAAGGRIVSQRLCLEFVYWEDYAQGLARQDKDVPWKARRHTPSKAEFRKQFGLDDDVKIDAGYKIKDASEENKAGQDDGDKVELWEVWVKASRKRLWVARGYPDLLEPVEDPYGLTTFYPCPRPLRSVTTTDRMIPEPEFCQYQDQANELDELSTRIMRLTGQIRWKGIYDASLPDANAPASSTLADLAEAGDGQFIPFATFAALNEKGGIEAAFGFWPIGPITEVVVQLAQRRAQLIEEIYQITGISDIVRGSTDPRETKGAQQIKAQFGSMRMQSRQREVQRFIRDTYRIIAEIIAEHFTQETLAEITQMDLPTREEQMQLKQKIAMLQQPPGMGHNGGPPMDPGAVAPAGVQAPAGPPQPPAPEIPKALMERASGPTWDDVMEILRSDKLRGYRVDIETDATVMEDADLEKQRRIEAVTGIKDLLQGAFAAGQALPQALPLVKELTLFGLRAFKPARSLEQAVEDTFDDLMENPPQPPQEAETVPPDVPPEVKAAEIQKRLEIEEGKAKVDAEHKQASLAVDAEYKRGSLDIERQKLDLERQSRGAKMQIEAAKVGQAERAHEDSMGMEHERMAHERDAGAQDFELRRQAAESKAAMGTGAA